MSISRNQQNYIVMTIIYEALADLSVHKDYAFRTFDELVSDFSVNEIVSELDSNVNEIKADNFIVSTVDQSLRHYVEIVKVITPKLKNWTWDRIPLLTQAILLMSIARVLYVDKIDKRIAIDIAVNLAKKYIDEKQAGFIHALLDEVL